MPNRSKAVIWLADDPEWERYAARCVDYCDRVGYEVVAVISGHAGGSWDDVTGVVIRDGRAGVCVVASRDQLPRDRTPRIEVVADERRHVVPARAIPGRPQFLRRR